MDGFMVGDRVRLYPSQRLGTVVAYPEMGEYPVQFDDEPDEVYYCFAEDLERDIKGHLYTA